MMDDFGKLALRERQALRIARRQRFWLHLILWASLSAFLVVVWALTSRSYPWPIFPICAWTVVIAVHWAYAYVMKDPEEILIGREARTGEARQP
jgi:hypothetical protein